MTKIKHCKRSKYRRGGFISYWQPSKSGGYGFIKGDTRRFFHASDVVTGDPRIGARVVFTILPAKRAGEVEIGD